MPIRNCKISNIHRTPGLISIPVSITNPRNNKSIKLHGIIDTGASECFVPAQLSRLLEFDYKTVRESSISTGNGMTKAYKHLMNITVYHPDPPERELIVFNNVFINFMETVPIFLLGVNGFLSEFHLQVEYRNGIFSLMR